MWGTASYPLCSPGTPPPTPYPPVYTFSKVSIYWFYWINLLGHWHLRIFDRRLYLRPAPAPPASRSPRGEHWAYQAATLAYQAATPPFKCCLLLLPRHFTHTTPITHTTGAITSAALRAGNERRGISNLRAATLRALPPELEWGLRTRQAIHACPAILPNPLGHPTWHGLCLCLCLCLCLWHKFWEVPLRLA